MQDPARRRSTTLAPSVVLAGTALVCAAIFLVRERHLAGAWGFSLDDSWIHATIARNIAAGHGYSFNPGETTGGSTAPLYTFLLAALFAVAGPSVLGVKILGILAHTSSCVLLYHALVVPTNKAIALVSALAAAVSPSLLWASVSGMEIPVYILLLIAGIDCHVRGKMLLGIALWTLGVWVRPDGILIPILYLMMIPGRRLERFGVFASLAIPYFLFNFLVGHAPFPASVATKAHPAGASQVFSFLRTQGDLWGIPTRAGEVPLQSPLLLVAAVVGGAVGGRFARFLLLYVVTFAIAFGLVAANAGPQHRYLLPLVPIVVCLACFGIQFGLERIRSSRRSLARAIISISLLAPGLSAIPRMAEAHAWNVQNINGMQRFIGEWIAARTNRSDKIAANDIGAIGFFAKRYIVDTAGLITPRAELPTLLSIYRPRLLIIYPNWYRAYGHVDSVSSDLYFDDADSTNRYWGLFGVQLRHNTVAARDKLLAFVRTRRGAPAPRNLWMYHN